LLVLEINNLAKNFGGLAAVVNLDLSVNQGEIFGVIGPNGAGKSTILNMIDGSLRPTGGKIIFKGEDTTDLAPHRRAREGIARVFQSNILFSDVSVMTNVRIGFHMHSGIGFWTSFLGVRKSIKRQEMLLSEKAVEILKFVGLYEEKDKEATSLPHASQRKLGLAIALAVDPTLLLLDEPLAGMTAEEVASMLTVVRGLREKKGITCVIVEHNMKAIMRLCDRIAVINYGKKIAEGPPMEISKNPEVIEAYLGAPEHAI
jgi:branched-chain amino acid transport system ATP-binding protein